MAKRKREAIENNEFTDFDTHLYRAVLEEERPKFSPENYQRMLQQFDSDSDELDTITAVDQLAELEEASRFMEGLGIVQLKAQAERNAWANALNACRNMQHAGINVFAGTKQDIFDYADKCLATYQAGYEPFLTDKTQFVHGPNKDRF